MARAWRCARFIVCLTILLTLSLAVPVVAQTLVTLRGGGLEVSADLAGWNLMQGPAVLGASYVRLGFYSKDSENLSLFVDHLPRGVTDLDSLCRGSMQDRAGENGLTMVEPKGFAGKEACLFTFTVPTIQRSVYVELIANGKWVEFHYSTGDGRDSLAKGRKTMEDFIASLKTKPDETAPDDTMTGDVKDEQVVRVEQFLKCAPSA